MHGTLQELAGRTLELGAEQAVYEL